MTHIRKPRKAAPGRYSATPGLGGLFPRSAWFIRITHYALRFTNKTMKTKLLLAITVLPALADVGRAQPTAFTYQGRLTEGAHPATGTYDLRFALYDSSSGPNALGGALTNAGVAVTEGLFTVALDFGASVFDGGARWLEIAVRTNGALTFDTLSPRQRVTPTPYAITAGSVISGGLAPGAYGNAVSFYNPANEFAGNGGGLTNVDAASLGGVAAANFWQTGGNGGSSGNWYVGTLDYQPLELRVNQARALRIAPTAAGWPNLTAGASNNVIFGDVTAASINGGVNNRIADTCGSSTIGGGRNNFLQTNAAGSAIGGGQWNVLGDGSVRSVISGGYSNVIRGFTSTNAAGIARDITDGTSNTLLLGETPPGNATIGGGYLNTIGQDCNGSVIAGGEQISLGDGSVRSVVGGGNLNQIGLAVHNGFIGGGARNSIGDGASYASLIGGAYNIIGNTCVGGVISGGESNRLGDGAVDCCIGGGRRNQIVDGTSNTILAGENNATQTGADHAVIGGGRWNTNGGPYAVIPGGARNYASGAYSFAAGRRARSIHDGCFVWADAQDADFVSTANNQFNVRADGSVRFITSGAGMTLDGQPVLAGTVGSTQLAGTYVNAVTFANAANSFSGIFAGNGSGLTGLNASALASGSVPDARLTANVALRAGGNDFTGDQTVMGGSVGIGTTSPLAPLHVNTPIGEPADVMLTSGGSWALSLVQTPSSVMVISNGGAGRIFMPSSGNVGLGNTNPLHKLHVGNYGNVTTINNSPVKAVVENTNENGRATLVAVAGPGTASNSTNRVEIMFEADEGQRIGLLGTMSDHPLQVRVVNNTRLFIGTNGNVGIGTLNPTNNLHVNGGITCTALTQTSDRNAKEDFQPVSPVEVLGKVAALPITRWKFKHLPDGQHLGPVAQDFYAAFQLGNSDTTITAIDADGVALAAIQGLNQKLTEELKQKQTEITELKQRLEKLEQVINRWNGDES